MDTVRRYSMFIGGDWVDADERFEIRSPATEELVASVAKGSREHAEGRLQYFASQARSYAFVHIDLSGRLDRRAYPLLLSTPPQSAGQ